MSAGPEKLEGKGTGSRGGTLLNWAVGNFFAPYFPFDSKKHRLGQRARVSKKPTQLGLGPGVHLRLVDTEKGLDSWPRETEGERYRI